MVKLFSKLYYPVYKKMILSYILIVALTVSIISIVLFYAFSTSSAREISNTSIAMLEQTSYASDVIYQELFPIGNILMNDNNVITSMFTDHLDPLNDFKTVKLLSHISSIYPFIQHIGIYNTALERYVGTRGITKRMDPEVIERIKAYQKKHYLEFFPRKIIPNFLGDYDEKNLQNVITFILYPEYSLYEKPKGVIIIDLDEGYLNSMLNQLNSKGHLSSEMFVMDSAGTVLSHSSPDVFLKNLSDREYVRNVIESKMSSGSFSYTEEGKELLVSYVKSENLKWIFINTQPYNMLLSNIYRLKNLTLFLTLLIILVSIVVSFLLTGKIYSPLESIVKKLSVVKRGRGVEDIRNVHFNEFSLIQEELTSITERNKILEENVKQTLPAFKELYLRSLLKPSSVNIQYSERITDMMKNELAGPYFAALVFKIDGFKHFRQYSQKDQSVYLFAIWNIAHELLSGKFNASLAIMEQDEVSIILQFRNTELLNLLQDYIKEIQHIIKSYYKLSFSVALGSIANSTDKLQGSYLDALEAMKYRLFFGYGCFVLYDAIKDRQELTFKYPASLEKKLIDLLKLNNTEMIPSVLDAFKKELMAMTCDHALTYSNQLGVSILKHYDRLLDTLSEDTRKFLQIVRDLSSFETLDDVIASIQSLCTGIIAMIEEKYNQKNIDVIEQVKQLVSENYSNPDLSIDTAADKVMLSPAYLGRLFRNIEGISFNEYLNMFRIQKAKELLLHTNIPSSEICVKVGIYNKTYFFTLFKKTFGITPSTFRKENPLTVAEG